LKGAGCNAVVSIWVLGGRLIGDELSSVCCLPNPFTCPTLPTLRFFLGGPSVYSSSTSTVLLARPLPFTLPGPFLASAAAELCLAEC